MKLPRNTKVALMLADHAQVAEGKLFISGGGWSVRAGDIPFAVVATVEMPWDAQGVQHQFKLELVDDEGRPVEVPGQDGNPTPLVIEAGFQLTAAPGTRRGTPLSVPIAMNFAPAPPIPAGGRYEWRLEINGETHEDWRLGFSTLPFPQSKAA